jgi:hypothetical protein
MKVTRFIITAQRIRNLVYCSDTALVIPLHQKKKKKKGQVGKCEFYELFRA